MKWYWFNFRRLPVTVHLKQDRHFLWQWICGVQIGPWFFGAIRGNQVEPSEERTPAP